MEQIQILNNNTSKKNNTLGYLIESSFRNINKLFVILFKNGNNDPTRDSFDKYYMSLVEIKDFNALIDNKPFFDQPVKSKQQAFEKLIDLSKNDEYTMENLLYLLHHQNYYKLTGIDLSKTSKYKYSSTN